MFNSISDIFSVSFSVLYYIVIAVIIIGSIVTGIKFFKKANSKTEESDSGKNNNSSSSTAESEHDKIIGERLERQKQSGGKKAAKKYHDKLNRYVNYVDDTSNATYKSSSDDDAHKHPSAAPSPGTRIRVEKRPAPTGSIGYVGDEGCGEHDNLRYVLEEVDTRDKDADKEIAELQKIVVWSELIGKPKSERNGR